MLERRVKVMYIAGTNSQDVIEFFMQNDFQPVLEINESYTYYFLTDNLIMLTDSYYDLISQ